MIERVYRHLYIPEFMGMMRNCMLLTTVLWWLSCTTPVQVPDQADPVERIDFSYLQEEGKIYIGALVKNPFNGDAIRNVVAAWFGTSGLDGGTADSVFLGDIGADGDILYGDQLHAKKVKISSVRNSINYGSTGKIYLKIVAHYEGGVSHELADSFSLGNIYPRFLMIDTPETLQLPDSGLAKLITVRAQAEDANGLDDIQWVGFTSKRLSDNMMLNQGNYIYMVDTGDTTYGDKTKGDGIFTALVSFPYNASTGELEWRFRVQDWKGGFDVSTKVVVVEK
ncbi:MAG: hypothetical protein CMG71_01725 [Candidatus Marinimicrobia bacterium]|nr:hypothetical protein [Candidatus Neomarinimicrobiota bacterium]